MSSFSRLYPLTFAVGLLNTGLCFGGGWSSTFQAPPENALLGITAAFTAFIWSQPSNEQPLCNFPVITHGKDFQQTATLFSHSGCTLQLKGRIEIDKPVTINRLQLEGVISNEGFSTANASRVPLKDGQYTHQIPTDNFESGSNPEGMPVLSVSSDFKGSAAIAVNGKLSIHGVVLELPSEEEPCQLISNGNEVERSLVETKDVFVTSELKAEGFPEHIIIKAPTGGSSSGQTTQTQRRNDGTYTEEVDLISLNKDIVKAALKMQRGGGGGGDKPPEKPVTYDKPPPQPAPDQSVQDVTTGKPKNSEEIRQEIITNSRTGSNLPGETTNTTDTSLTPRTKELLNQAGQVTQQRGGRHRSGQRTENSVSHQEKFRMARNVFEQIGKKQDSVPSKPSQTPKFKWSVGHDPSKAPPPINRCDTPRPQDCGQEPAEILSHPTWMSDPNHNSHHTESEGDKTLDDAYKQFDRTFDSMKSNDGKSQH